LALKHTAKPNEGAKAALRYCAVMDIGGRKVPTASVQRRSMTYIAQREDVGCAGFILLLRFLLGSAPRPHSRT